MSKQLTILIGIPGSGKTTYAKQHLLTNADICYVSSDDIREELFGDASVQKDPKRVFGIAYERTTAALDAGKDVVFDSTATTVTARRQLLNACAAHANSVRYIVLNTPLNECLRRNRLRDRQVPEEVIRRQYRNMSRPNARAGDIIIISCSA